MLSVCELTLTPPELSAGAWTLRLDAVGSIPVYYRLTGVNAGDSDTPPIIANIHVADGGSVLAPAPLLITASLLRSQPIARANVEGEIIGPDGASTSFTLADDGVAPDIEADDGVYTALATYTQNGKHVVRVSFDNAANSAVEVFGGGEHTPPIEGEEAPEVDLQPVAENFQRSAEAEVVVSGVSDDDHGDTSATATPILFTNVDIDGKMDRAGDSDWFEILSPMTDTIVVRVAGLAFDMRPQLRLLDAEGAELARQTLDDAGPDGYVWLSLAVSAEDVIYAEVTDTDGKAGGIYQISAGSPIPATSEQPRWAVYLPMMGVE